MAFMDCSLSLPPSLPPSGDNLLTAVSVARECGMVATNHRVIALSATPLQVTFDLLGGPPAPPPSSESGAKQSASTPLLCYNAPSLGPRPFHLAVDGRSFAVVLEHYRDELLPRVCFPEVGGACMMSSLLMQMLVCGTVFARMSPDQKAQLVTELQAIG